jgi:hypothetical protein
VSGPPEQEELRTLEAELREALQHQRAAYERMVETQRAIDALTARARALLARVREGRAPPGGAGSGAARPGDEAAG